MATAEDVERTDDDGTDGAVVEDDSETGRRVDEERVDENVGDEDDRYTRKKSVLITGCSSGIGRATATAFLRDDWQVFATARNPDDIAALEEAGCTTFALDVTDPEQVAEAVERVTYGHR